MVMNMNVRLEMRQTQKLLMVPMLRQAISLLQLSRQELVQAVRKELTENPFLEDAADEYVEGLQAGDRQRTEQKKEEVDKSRLEEITKIVEDGGALFSNDFEWENFFSDNIDWGYPKEEEYYKPGVDNIPSSCSISLQEHLRDQLVLSAGLSESEIETGEFIVGNLDDNGYLQVTLEEIVEATKHTINEVREILCLIQSFDPIGVGAKDVRECLLLQYRYSGNQNPLLERVIEKHLKKIEERRYQEIAKAEGITVEQVNDVIKIISSYDPKPGRRFNSEEARYIIPDIYVFKVEDKFTILLNDENVPRLRISPLYKNILLDGENGVKETKKFIEDKFKSAVWLIRSIQQRQRTLYKVAESIVKFQKEFLDRGVDYIKPLVLKQVADDISMHESTVSRITTNKYVHTPRGIFELKYFFHGGFNDDYGEMVSSLRIKEMIKKIITDESERLDEAVTDTETVKLLKNKGINIARRTVAKYREELNIPSAATRKRLKNV
ncbi:MAG: RNA polymerase factor sigma-54 [bacterium]